MRKYDYNIFIKHFVSSIYYFQHIEMAEMEEHSVDPESDVDVVATSSSVLPPDATSISSAARKSRQINQHWVVSKELTLIF